MITDNNPFLCVMRITKTMNYSYDIAQTRQAKDFGGSPSSLTEPDEDAARLLADGEELRNTHSVAEPSETVSLASSSEPVKDSLRSPSATAFGLRFRIWEQPAAL